MSATVTDAPLTRYRITGIVERWVGINAGTPAARKVPGGACWHCGTGIAICVQVEHVETGEVHEIGTTCAERVGLDAKQLKEMLAEKYAEDRWARSAAVRREREAAAARWEAEQTAEHGEHGTESRYRSGCFCQPCRESAPHGDVECFRNGCRCADCIAAILAAEPKRYFVADQWDVIVSLRTGETVRARKVDTRYGYRWCIDDGAAWLPVSPKRRSTHANKGYVQASAPWLIERCKSTRSRHPQDVWYKPICPLGEPVADIWGEPIPRLGGGS